jgi:hypothetical protein
MHLARWACATVPAASAKTTIIATAQLKALPFMKFLQI